MPSTSTLPTPAVAVAPPARTLVDDDETTAVAISVARIELDALVPLERLEFAAGALEQAAAAVELIVSECPDGFRHGALAEQLAAASILAGGETAGIDRARAALDTAGPELLDHAAGALEQATAGLMYLAEAHELTQPLTAGRLTRTAGQAATLASDLRHADQRPVDQRLAA